MLKPIKKIPETWNHLTDEEIYKIYKSEIKHSNRLRVEDKRVRQSLYQRVYDDYFSELPFHPTFHFRKKEKIKKNRLEYLMKKISPLLKGNENFIEIGAGDCSLSYELSKYVKKIYALEVSDVTIDKKYEDSKNMEIIIFNGYDFPFEKETIDFAFSNQLLEHLHKDDAIEQTNSIYKCLKNGGKYMCITPNRLIGPGDITGYFGHELKGFHLKEYTSMELKKIFKTVGFRKIKFQSIIKGKSVFIPTYIIWITEKYISLVAKKKRTKILQNKLISIIFNSVIIAIK